MAVIAAGGPAGGLAAFMEEQRKRRMTSGPPRRNSYRHHPGGYNIPANASLTPESQAVRDYQGFVSEGSPHTSGNYPRELAGLQTFMGMPVKGGKKINKAKDTAEWNPQENIYPKFMVDQLLRKGVITLDDIFDMGAPDGDSFKIIPRGTGRFDSTRRA